MKLALSNIAWDASQDDAVAQILRQYDIHAVEVAPTKYWPAPCEPAPQQIAQQRATWNTAGVEIVAAQSLLFGKPELNFLGEPEMQAETITYLFQIMDVCTALGANRFVFGSPRNRDRSGLDDTTTQHRALLSFKLLAKYAQMLDSIFCLEPNPTVYNCNFLTTAPEALAMVQAVDHPGCGLHLDTGIMYLNGEDPVATIDKCAPWLRHFHLSEPQLAAIGPDRIDHAGIAAALRQINYTGYVSVEMRPAETAEQNLLNTEAACQILKKHYS